MSSLVPGQDQKQSSPPPPFAPSTADLERRLRETQTELEAVGQRIARHQAEARAICRALDAKQPVLEFAEQIKRDLRDAEARRSSLEDEFTCLARQLEAAAKLAERQRLDQDIAAFQQDTAALVGAVLSALAPLQEQADALEVRLRQLISRWGRQQRGEHTFGRRLHDVQAIVSTLRELLQE